MIVGSEILPDNDLFINEQEKDLSVDDRYTVDKLRIRLRYRNLFAIELVQVKSAISYKMMCFNCNSQSDPTLTDREQMLWILGFGLADFNDETQSRFRNDDICGLWPDSNNRPHDDYLNGFDGGNSSTAELPLYPMRRNQRITRLHQSNAYQFVSLQCLSNGCFNHPYPLFRSYFFGPSAERLSKTTYTPIYSKIHMPASQPRRSIVETEAYVNLHIKPKEGIYAGTYGGHGIEFVLIHYVMSPVPIIGDANVEFRYKLCLEALKITGGALKI